MSAPSSSSTTRKDSTQTPTTHTPDHRTTPSPPPPLDTPTRRANNTPRQRPSRLRAGVRMGCRLRNGDRAERGTPLPPRRLQRRESNNNNNNTVRRFRRAPLIGFDIERERERGRA